MTTPIERNRRDFERKLANIRSNADLTAEAKRRMIQEAYDEARMRHEELAAEQRQKEVENISRLEREVMGVRYPFSVTDSDKEMIRMSYRDAYDRASYAGYLEENPGAVQEELMAMLERADYSDDPQFAAAVYHVATRKGIRPVADRYLESRPEEKRRWERYVAARQEAEGIDRILFGEHAMAPARPPELDGYPAPSEADTGDLGNAIAGHLAGGGSVS